MTGELIEDLRIEVSECTKWVVIWVTPSWRRKKLVLIDVYLDEDLEVAGDIEWEGDLLGWIPIFYDFLSIHYLKSLLLAPKMLMDKNDHDQYLGISPSQGPN